MVLSSQNSAATTRPAAQHGRVHLVAPMAASSVPMEEDVLLCDIRAVDKECGHINHQQAPQHPPFLVDAACHGSDRGSGGCASFSPACMSPCTCIGLQQDAHPWRTGRPPPRQSPWKLVPGTGAEKDDRRLADRSLIVHLHVCPALFAPVSCSSMFSTHCMQPPQASEALPIVCGSRPYMTDALEDQRRFRRHVHDTTPV